MPPNVTGELMMTGLGCMFNSEYKAKRYMASSAVRNYVFWGGFGALWQGKPSEFSRSQKRQVAKAYRKFHGSKPSSD